MKNAKKRKSKIRKPTKEIKRKIRYTKKEADRNNRSKYTYIIEYHRAMDALNKAMNEAKIAGAYNMIKTQIINEGECYAWTVAEAEFRRAHRWNG